MLNKILFIFLLLCGMSHAQLSVRNNAYVFVNDEIIFVNDNVNLNEADSRIYLRNEAQLIQGSGTTGNSGMGELSLYQEGDVGEYEYNYWCSPIGVTTNNNANNPFGISLLNDATGLVTSTPAIVASSSSFNSTSSPLTIEPYWIWKYIAASSYSDWIHVKGNASINPGEGFTMKGTIGSGDAQRYDFRGKPNTGTIAVNVLNNQFTLVGNPYPSALDAVAYIHDTQNASVITGSLYFWEQNPAINSHYLSDTDGGYATYTIDITGIIETYTPAVFATYNNNGTINGISGTLNSGKRPRRYIPIGQGFMVEGTNAGVVRAKNSHRVYVKETASNSGSFKIANGKGKSQITETSKQFSMVPADYKRFRLNIDFNNTYTRQLVETFHSSATNGFDYGLESKINATDILKSDAYWSPNNETFLAEALAFDETLKIPLTINASKNMPVSIRISDLQNFNSSQPIYIHDIEKDLFIDLKNQDYNINLEPGQYTNRFEVTFSKNTLNVEANLFEGIQVFQNNNLSELTIKNPNSFEIQSFELFDVTGKLVLRRKILSKNKTYTHATKSLSEGVYIVNLSFENNLIFSKKIIVTNKK
jgi:hypothetical protein